MEDRRIGRLVRALRRRRGWRQQDVADAAGCAQTTVSLIERGHLDATSLRTLRDVAAALDARLALEVNWRGAALERLIDRDHAVIVGIVVDELLRHGWVAHVEVTYSQYGERGSYDILAMHQRTGTLLVVEVKTDLPSVEGTLRKLDEKVRLAPTVARETFGFRAKTVSRLLVMPESSTFRRRIAEHAAVIDRALPARSWKMRRFIARPESATNGIWLLSPSTMGAALPKRLARDRVRRSHPQPPSSRTAA